MYVSPQQHIDGLKAELVNTIRFLHEKGWAPATSSNYSFRAPGEDLFWISQSGVDKSYFGEEQLMLINAQGEAVEEPDRRSSAETLLHTLLYEQKETAAVLHTHTVNNTVLSMAHENDGGIKFYGYEVLKGIRGVRTHETEVFIPIFPNSQDMETLAAEIRNYYHHNPDMPAFLLAGHGLYCWGSSIAEAKRHIEVFEFLFECKIKQKLYGNS